jgi:hypothetical protein
MSGPVKVLSCHEAGYDGFWLHRILLEAGIINHVIDPASLQVNRRARRAKKPLPASPARAASMVALRASRLVCEAMSLIRSTTSPIFCEASTRPWTSSVARLDWEEVAGVHYGHITSDAGIPKLAPSPAVS